MSHFNKDHCSGHYEPQQSTARNTSRSNIRSLSGEAEALNLNTDQLSTPGTTFNSHDYTHTIDYRYQTSEAWAFSREDIKEDFKPTGGSTGKADL